MTGRHMSYISEGYGCEYTKGDDGDWVRYSLMTFINGVRLETGRYGSRTLMVLETPSGCEWLVPGTARLDE